MVMCVQNDGDDFDYIIADTIDSWIIAIEGFVCFVTLVS